MFPDFSVERYWGADDDINPNPDIVRIVVEVGSLMTLNQAVQNAPRRRAAARCCIREVVTRQLEDYLVRVGDQFCDRLLGVAMIGNRVALRVRTNRSVQDATLIPGY